VRQIDEQSYSQGVAAFHKGVSLRQLLEKRLAMEKANEDPKADWRKAESIQMSYELGFADAVLTKLRSR